MKVTSLAYTRSRLERLMMDQGRADRSARRVNALDWLRAFAVVQMVQGHTLDALLDVSLRAGTWFEAWRWLRGITAPSFLFCAGFAFVLAHRRRPKAVFRRMRRAFMLVALGYALRTPWLALLLYGEIGQSDLQSWLWVDVLQCIGVTLILLEATMLLSALRRQVTLTLLGVLCLLLGPAGLSLESFGPFASLPVAARNYFGQPMLFALFPWVGYAAAGALLAEAQLQSSKRGVRFSLLAVLVGCGAVGGITGGLSSHGLRLVAVLALFLSLDVMTSRAKLGAPAFARRLSEASLFVYVMHIVVIYADNVGLASSPGPVLSLSVSLACAIVLLVLCLLARSAWLGVQSWRLRRRNRLVPTADHARSVARVG